MAPDNKTSELKPNSRASARTTLILKIAVFLNYLSRENYNHLIQEFDSLDNTSDTDPFKMMLAKKYIDEKDLNRLKKTCLNFVKPYEDKRFGSLCIYFDFLTQSNLGLALEEQKLLANKGRNFMLGDLLTDAGMLSEGQRDIILKKQAFEQIGQDDKAARDTGTPEVPPIDKSRMIEIIEPGIIFLISDDRLNGFAVKTDDFNNDMTPDDIRFLLKKNRITYGVVDDEDMFTFIKDDPHTTPLFEIARGLEPLDDKAAQIVYVIDQEYLTPGHLEDDGSMDFKDRGDLPFVKKGDILAEKIPPVQGKDGIDIFGDVVPKTDAQDISFNIGKGVLVSQNGSKLYAEVEGNPQIDPGGIISVADACVIEGDVDYTTGHIKFNKNVIITGAVKSGFRVEAIDVSAHSIDGGIIIAQGDVSIQNGVTESAIEAKGNITAGYIHKSKVTCLENLTISKEMTETEVVVQGAFEMSRGRLLSSLVCAKGGADIHTIGSEKSGASTLVIGKSIYLEKKLQQMDAEIGKQQKQIETKTTENNKLHADIHIVSEKLEKSSKRKARSLSRIEEENQAGGKDAVSQINQLKNKINALDRDIHELKTQKMQLGSQRKKIADDIAAYEKKIKLYVNEKFKFKRLDQSKPSKPILKLNGTALAGTKVIGNHARLILKDPLTHSKIVEDRGSQSDAQRKEWEMYITPL